MTEWEYRAVSSRNLSQFSADGRCISLLKILFTNECIYDCKYCVNRRTNDVVRTSFYAGRSMYAYDGILPKKLY